MTYKYSYTEENLIWASHIPDKTIVKAWQFLKVHNTKVKILSITDYIIGMLQSILPANSDSEDVCQVTTYTKGE